MTRKATTQIIDAEEPSATPIVPMTGTLEEKGYSRVTLPDLPSVEMMYVRNRANCYHDIASEDDKVKNLVLPPHSEQVLPHHEFWILHPVFRSKIEDRVTDEGNTQLADIQVFQRTKEYKHPKTPPANIAVLGQWLAPVQQIVYAPWVESAELIAHEPMIGVDQTIINVRFLAEKWTKVLQHALFVCKDNRRCGKEVDQRRIDALTDRIAEIEQMRRENNITALD